MKKVFSLLVIFFIIFNNASAQKEIVYINPPANIGEGYSISLDDIVSNESLCKLRLTVENSQSDTYYVYYLQKSGFEFEKLGKYYEKKVKGVVIDPNSKDAVVVKVTDNDYRFKSFTFHPEGLFSASTKTASLQVSNLLLKPGNSDKIEKDGVQIILSDVSADKKGVISVTLEIGLSASANNVLLLIDPSKMSLVTEKGQNIDSDFKNDKKKAILAGDSKKIKFSFTTTETAQINWNDALKVMPLVPVKVPAIKIIDQISAPVAAPETKPATTTVVEKAAECNPYMAQQNAPVKVTVQSEDVCFKLSIDGFPVVTTFSSPAMFYRTDGRQKFKFTLTDGTEIEETSYISDKYSAVGYKIVKKNDGTYAVRYDMWAQVLTEEAKKERDENMADMKAKNEGFSGESGCFGPASSGATLIKLKVYWKGNPVVSHGIRIRQYGTIISVGVTDESGFARLGTNELKGRDIEVEGCVGRYSWSVSGSYCVLDSNNSLTLNLDEVARSISQASGRSIDEIGRGWGF